MTNTNSQVTVSVARDFSPVPAGRFISDGEVSGQVFREKVLVPLLKKSNSLIIDLDGCEGFGSSFLEEAFGGLIREEHYKYDQLIARLSFKSEEEPTLIAEIMGYLSDARDLNK